MCLSNYLYLPASPQPQFSTYFYPPLHKMKKKPYDCGTLSCYRHKIPKGKKKKAWRKVWETRNSGYGYRATAGSPDSHTGLPLGSTTLKIGQLIWTLLSSCTHSAPRRFLLEVLPLSSMPLPGQDDCFFILTVHQPSREQRQRTEKMGCSSQIVLHLYWIPDSQLWTICPFTLQTCWSTYLVYASLYLQKMPPILLLLLI